MIRPSLSGDSPLPPHQATHLKRWLREWELHQQLLAAEAPALEVAPADAMVADAPPANPYHPDVQVGDIRIPAPDLLPAAEIPPFVAVVGRWEDDWVVVPYSPFASPAFPSELALNDAPPLSVLQIWNARVLDAYTLRQSWRLRTLDIESCRDAYDLFGHFFAAQPFPERLKDRVGAPLRSLLDPRFRYQQEQRGLFAPLRLGAIPWIPAERILEWIHAIPEEELAMAAAGGELSIPVRSPDGWMGETKLHATADLPFVLVPGQTTVPGTVWILPEDMGEDVRKRIAGSPAILVRLDLKKAVARGRVDREGQSIRMEELVVAPVQEALTEQHTLCIFLLG